jgi:DNA-binding PadR family transcriptional regulator
MSEIEGRTNGHWKPSPGSIYPLLSWLQDQKFIKDAVEQEIGLKRYTLTEDGKAFLKEHVERSEELRKRFSLFKPPFFGFPWLNHYPEKTQELFEAGKRLVMSSWKVLDNLRENYSEEVATEAKDVIDEAAVKMDKIVKKLSG